MNFQFYIGYLLLTSSLEWSAAQKVSRIIGGQRITIEDCPYIVSIMIFGKHHCGGTLIRSEWVISAAHCMSAGALLIPIKAYGIAAGTGELTSETINSFNTKEVNEIYIHPGYDNNYSNDIALLKVKEPFEFSKKIKAALLLTSPLQFQEMDPDLGKVSGWGTTIPHNPYKSQLPKSRGTLHRLLRQVSVPIHSSAHCTAFFKSQHMRMEPTSVLCSGGIENEDACQGDSGGPLLVKSYLIGIVSWGVGCGMEGYPGVYTRVDYFLPWVNDTIDGRNIPNLVRNAAVGFSFRLPWSLHILVCLITLISLSEVYIWI